MITVKNLPFENVVASGVASLSLPLGMTYNRIILKLGGTTFTKAMITRILCKLNGKIFLDCTGSRLDDINEYKGLASDAAFLTIDFTEPRAKTVGGMYMGAIGTSARVSSFTIEVTIAGATAPTLESWSMVTEPMPLGLINALINHPVSFSAAGKFPITLPHGAEAKHLLKRVYFFHTNMTHLEVKKNGLLIFEELAIAENEFIQGEYELVPQAGLYVYDAIVSHDFKRVVDLADAKSFQLNPTVSAGDTINVYADYITRLELL